MDVFSKSDVPFVLNFFPADHLRPEGVALTQTVSFPAVQLVKNCHCDYGGLGLFRRGLLPHFDPMTFPEYVKNMTLESLEAGKSSVWFGSMFDSNCGVVEVDQPVVAALHPNWIFGHFLLEMLPKLVLLDRIVDPAFPLLVAKNGPTWMIDILAQVSRRRLFEYDSKTSVVRAPAYYTMTNLDHRGWLRPEMRTAFDILRASVLLESDAGTHTRRLYVSRRRAEGGWHKIENEEAIEAALEAEGFMVIHPQELKFAEQVRLFHSATFVVGEYSSAMHNTAFCRPSTRVLCLNRINRYQEQLAATFRHQIGFLRPDDGQYRDWSAQRLGFQSLTFDPARVCDAVRSIPDDQPSGSVSLASQTR